MGPSCRTMVSSFTESRCAESAAAATAAAAAPTSSWPRLRRCFNPIWVPERAVHHDQDLGEQLIPPFKKMKITPPVMMPAQPPAPKKERSRRQLAKTTREASVPTWGQLKKLTTDAQQVVKEQGVQVTPSNLFLAMMALVSCQVSMAAAETYWTYVPDPPVVNPATWTGESVPVFTNNTNVVGVAPTSI
ncbi:hypothetical protein QTO34_004860 [Cnephaeus nilssonii]|uniref:Rec21/ENK19 domain-containing protein n=1 Tax=Cnephaeus nilssonii TaxID=3371016 RepID=A0AA40HQ30_CNENI|nr:hypothetical protein QTO34_004860 [Eptesicus nilssonii]